MVPELSTTKVDVHPYDLTDDQLLGIGRLVRATARIEELITYYLCNLADLTIGQAIIILGRMPPSARLKLAETFAMAKGDNALILHKESFGNENYQALIRCRNTAVHGKLLGETSEGLVAFQVQETQGVEGVKIYATVNAYAHDSFANAAFVAEGVIPQLIEKLKLQPWLDKLQTRELDPHLKTRPKAKKKATPSRQR